MADAIQLVSAYDPAPWAKLKPQILLLTPFFNGVIIYFVFVNDGQHADLWSTIMKCAPIVFLMLYLVFKGLAIEQSYKRSVLVLIGLIFSCAGDALLNMDLFPHGMAAFGVAHVFYISSFGWKPLKLAIGLVLYLTGAALVGVLWKHLEGVLVFGVPIYGALLLTMCWRATALALQKRNFFAVFCAVGSFLFVLSDGLIIFNMFLIDMAYSRLWIMATYYTAQLSIALSTAEENKFAVAKKKSKKIVKNKD